MTETPAPVQNSSTPKASSAKEKKPVRTSRTPTLANSSTAKKRKAPAISDEAKRALWPASTVEDVPLKELIPSARNARTHSQSQVLAIARSMEERGWTSRVLRDEKKEIIAGHGRVLGAEVLVARGRTEFSIAPTMTAIGWTDAQKRAYVIADNALALQAGWDPKLLESELKEISGMGFQMELLGFSAQDLRRHLGVSGGGLTSPDAVPDPNAFTVSRPGDMWLCGRHRILCGDATSKTDVSRLFGGGKAALMVTDPPYGVDYNPSWRVGIRGQVKDVRAHGKVQNDSEPDWRDAWALFPGPVAYVWHAGKFCSLVEDSLKAANFEIRSQIIWRKPHFAISRGDYHWQHEPCWYAVRKNAKSNWRGGRKQSTMWDIAGLNPMGRGVRGPENAETDHGTQKPVDCMRRPIENNTDEGETVYDPFLGSGTTVIAAEQTNRVCFGLELNPFYVDVAVRRWQAFAGAKALLSGRELSFEEIDGERKVKQKGARRAGNGESNGKARAKAAAHKPAGDRGKPKPPPVQRARAEAAGG